MAEVQPSFGSQFWLEDPDSQTLLIRIAELQDITGPGVTRETIDVTTHDSPDGFREYIGSLKDGGEVTFSLMFDPSDTGHIMLKETIVRTGIAGLGARVYWPTADGDYAEFDCIPTSLSWNAPVAGVLSADFTAKVTGTVNLYSTANPSSSGLYT